MSEYAKAAGVDPSKINPFKRAMMEVGRRTADFPLRHRVVVSDDGSWRYSGKYEHVLNGRPIDEGLGNKNLIAEWMYKHAGDGKTHYQCIGMDTVRMASNDFIAQGGMPVTLNDHINVHDSSWFEDTKRVDDLANGFYTACKSAGMRLVGGESAVLKHLVKDAPILSASVTGIIAPSERKVDGSAVRHGDYIIGIGSSGMHSNGSGLMIARAQTLPDNFLTKLPSGVTFGEAVLTPTLCYVDAVQALHAFDVDIHALQPGTGGGVAKLTKASPHPFTYHIERWPQWPETLLFMLELGVSLEDCLTTFNCGIGYFVIVGWKDHGAASYALQMAGYEVEELGVVKEGEHCVILEPYKGLVLPPPGE